MRTVDLRAVVTGANRGLGQAIAACLLNDYRARVVMTARRPRQAMTDAVIADGAANRTALVPLDYTSPDSIVEAAQVTARILGRVDLLVNCAGINKADTWPPEASKGGLAHLRAEALTHLLNTNVVGPVMTCQAFLPLLREAARPYVINISTSRASLTSVDDPRSFGYAVSKAALNMATRKIAAELADYGGIVVAIDPGWLRTRMGGPEAPTDPADAAARLLRLVLCGQLAINGRFLTPDGEEVPW